MQVCLSERLHVMLTSWTGFLCVVPDVFNGEPIPVESMIHFLEDPGQQNVFQKMWRVLSIGWTILGTALPHCLHRQRRRLISYCAGLGPWFYRHKALEPLLATLENVIKELREKEGIQKVGMIGYCWGGRPTIKLASTDKVLLFLKQETN